jgi:hypothetical protein
MRMPQMQPYPPACPKCRKPMKPAPAKKAACGGEFRCAGCGEPDPMQDVELDRWLNGELRETK